LPSVKIIDLAHCPPVQENPVRMDELTIPVQLLALVR
jgi:hypothetical protein